MSEIDPNEIEFLIEGGPLVGKNFAVPKVIGMALQVGRDEDCEICFPSRYTEYGMVGRKHARIERRADGVYLLDKDSTNGTILDGLQLSPNKPYRLNRYGMRIQIGAEGPVLVVHRLITGNAFSTLIMRNDGDELGRLREEKQALLKQNETLTNAKRALETKVKQLETRVRELEGKGKSGSPSTAAGAAVNSERVSQIAATVKLFSELVEKLDDAMLTSDTKTAGDLVMTMLERLAELRTGVDRLSQGGA